MDDIILYRQKPAGKIKKENRLSIPARFSSPLDITHFSSTVQKQIDRLIDLGGIDENPDVLVHQLLLLLSRYCGHAPESITLFSGYNTALETLARIWIKPGDHIVIGDYQADDFRDTVERYGAIVDTAVPTVPFMVDINNLASKITAETRMLYLSSPNTVSGIVYAVDEIETVLNQFPALVLLLDESNFEFAPSDISRLINHYDNLIVRRTFSSGLGLKGIICDYLISSPKLSQLLKQRGRTEVSAIACLSAIAVFSGLDTIYHQLEIIRENMLYLSVRLRALGISSRITPADFILIRVNDTGRVRKILADENIITKDLSRYPLLQNYLGVEVKDDRHSQKIIDLFARMPEGYYRNNFGRPRRITLKRNAENKRESAVVANVSE